MEKKWLGILLVLSLGIIVSIVAYLAPDKYFDLIFQLFFIGWVIFAIGYLLYKKIGSKFEIITLTIIGIIFIYLIITESHRMSLGYAMLLWPFILLEWTKQDNNDSKNKKKIKLAFNFGIIFNLIVMVFLLFMKIIVSPESEVSLLSIIMYAIGTIISLSLVIEIKQKYFKNLW